MDPSATIGALDGAKVVGHTENPWGPSGTLGVANLKISRSNMVFDLLVPTSPNDIWDYIWRSEREQGSTEKVRLYQVGIPVLGSGITAITREGHDKRWDAIGPEQYRLTFVVPIAALLADMPVEVRFYWDDKVLASALGSNNGRSDQNKD